MDRGSDWLPRGDAASFGGLRCIKRVTPPATAVACMARRASDVARMRIEASKRSAVTNRGVRGTRVAFLASSASGPSAGTPAGRFERTQEWFHQARVNSMTPPRAQRSEAPGRSISNSSPSSACPHLRVSSGQRRTTARVSDAARRCAVEPRASLLQMTQPSRSVADQNPLFLHAGQVRRLG